MTVVERIPCEADSGRERGTDRSQGQSGNKRWQRKQERNGLVITLSLRAKARLRAMTTGENLSVDEVRRGYVKSTRDIIEQAYRAGIGPTVESIVAGFIDTVLIREMKPRNNAPQTKTKFVESKKTAKAA